MKMKKNEINVGERKEKNVDHLKDQASEMFDQLSKMLSLSLILIKDGDNVLAVNIIEEDDYLDNLKQELMSEINYFIIREQPKAGDLRLALSTYSLCSDIERIGDYFKNFAKMMLKTGIQSETHRTIVLNLFQELVLRIEETQLAYMTSNHELAKSIAKRDSEIDDATNKLIDDVNERLTKSLDYEEVKTLTRVLTFAKTIERAGDHLVNICEQISYMEKGQIYNYN